MLSAAIALAAVLLSACGSGDSGAAAPSSADLVIEGVTVVDAVNGVREGRTVVVDDGRITAVLDADDPEAGAVEALERVDGTGRVLIPGLWDFHVHLTRIPYLQAGSVRNGARMMATLPFGHRGRVASFDGGVAVVFSARPEVIRYDTTGALTLRVRLPAFERPLGPAVVDSMKEAALATRDTPELRELVETSYSMPVPEHLPTFEWVLVDGDVLVLGLHRSWARDGRQPWIFLAPAGRAAGVLWLPHGDRILDVEGSHVLVAGASPAGVPEVTVLELEEWRSVPPR